MVQADADAPLGGLFGEKFVNVLQINLALRNKYGQPQ
jgi:K+-transporting ATPase c subunit